MDLRIAYPGRDGAHAAAAAERLFGGAHFAPLPTFSAVVEAAAAAEVDFGVLPIESSLSGAVAETHDLLYEAPLSINAETILPIRHCLVGPAAVDLREIRIVHSHPVALDQCRRLLAAMPWATAVASTSTAEAASVVEAKADPAEVAIASERAAKLHGLELIAGDVGDHPEAYTRFVAVAPHTRVDGRGAEWRTAFSFVTDHQPGALHRAIEPFARLGVDLALLVSRPLPQTPWRYRFDGVLIGHPLDDLVREALSELRARTRRVHVAGSYPAAGSQADTG
jgi:chorismate mutase / prephenate dehydratase